MKEPILVIMAAGMASRFGALKQVEPITEHGEFIIDFSIYDAIQAGFKKVAFIIKKEDELKFKNAIGKRIQDKIAVEYIFQDINDVPLGYDVPEGRVKPWGTGHAVLCARDVANAPFAVINADDFYGRDAFIKIYNFLKEAEEDERYAMIGYVLENTLSDHGTVTRGVCNVENGYLIDIQEKLNIEKVGDMIRGQDHGQFLKLKPETTVSMNVWGFVPSIFTSIETGFMEFLELNLEDNPLTCEFILTFVISHILKSDRKAVKVLESKDKWFGMTYKEDKPMLIAAIKDLQERGVYPKNLWL
ncbi:MAG: nucleotidyltransferase [Candidatus Epulonipiscioides saccharophilum]|nr:MAG: nucleotidyltransferase [Epulopiscium sp. AS2M-Bin001]